MTYAEDNPLDREHAADLLARLPHLPAAGLAAAAVGADAAQLSRLLEAEPAAAVASAGPWGWSPLMYLTYSRIDADQAAVLHCAELLLAHGADTNEGRFFDGLATPFTVLTGCFGGGERDQPPHAHAIPLARLLLEHGAEPNDAQALYNRMFNENDDFLELLFEYGLGRGDGGPWRRLLPDLLPSPAEQLGALLQWAVVHDQRARVGLLIGRSGDVDAPLPGGGTAFEVALRNGHTELAEQLRGLGATDVALDPVEQFIAAALAGRTADVEATPRSVIAAARKARPAAIVWATGQQHPAAVDLLAAAGFDVNAYGRGDVPVEQQWQTALHTAVERGDAGLVQRLLDHGADPSLLDARFHSTPRDWAEHLGHPDLIDLLDAAAPQVTPAPEADSDDRTASRARPSGH